MDTRAIGQLCRVVAPALLVGAIVAGPSWAAPSTRPSLAPVVSAVAPAVVTIVAAVEPPDPARPGEDEDEDTLGSGVIVDPSGVVVTNAHVVRAAAAVEVLASDGRRYQPSKVAVDARSNVAVLTIGDGSRRFPHARLGDSDLLHVGDWVVAIGAPFGLHTTVTAGIISARGSDSTGSLEYLQTSAVMSPGSSGGPLVNLEGEVVGINTVAVLAGVGITFTIPSTAARDIIAQLRETGRVKRASLGIATQALTAELARALAIERGVTGALVADVAPETSAARAGLRPGDVVVSVDDSRVSTAAELARNLAHRRPGQTVTLVVRRRVGREARVLVNLGEEPEDPPSWLPAYAARRLGFDVRGLTPESGVAVSRIDRRAAPWAAGLRMGDIVREVNDVRVATVTDFARAVTAIRPGDAVALLVQRGPVAAYVGFVAGAP